MTGIPITTLLKNPPKITLICLNYYFPMALNKRELVQSIIKLIDKKHDRDTHDNAARLVIEILRVSRDSQYAPASDRFDDPLLNTLESAETVQLLLKIIFGRPVSTLKIPLKLPNVCRNSQALTMLKLCSRTKDTLWLNP